MSPDEIAQLTPEQFKELAYEHNDQVEKNEQDYQVEIDRAWTLPDNELENERAFLDHKRGQSLRFDREPLPIHEERHRNAVTDEQTRRYIEDRDKNNSQRPELIQDPTTGQWRELNDKELNHEIYRLNVLANHPDHEISEDEGRRLEYLEQFEARRIEESLPGNRVPEPEPEPRLRKVIFEP